MFLKKFISEFFFIWVMVFYYYKLEVESEHLQEYEKLLKQVLLSDSEKNLFSSNEGDFSDSSVVIPKESSKEKGGIEEKVDTFCFDVLHNSYSVRKYEKKFLRAEIPKVYSIELVVKASEEKRILFDKELLQSSYGVEKRRMVSVATFQFGTNALHPGAVDEYSRRLRSYVESKYENVRADISVNQNVHIDGDTGSTCNGMLTGDILSVLEIRRIVISKAESISMNATALTFLQK